MKVDMLLGCLNSMRKLVLSAKEVMLQLSLLNEHLQIGIFHEGYPWINEGMTENLMNFYEIS